MVRLYIPNTEIKANAITDLITLYAASSPLQYSTVRRLHLVLDALELDYTVACRTKTENVTDAILENTLSAITPQRIGIVQIARNFI